MRPSARLGVTGLLLAAVTLPLLSSGGPATAVQRVVGGQAAHAEDVPWVAALTSRERFGAERSGQFCGGAVVSARSVVTAAHCLSPEVLGTGREHVHDLRVITGRGDLTAQRKGQEIAVSGIWVNPAYDSRTHAGDVAVLSLAKRLPADAVLPMAGQDDPADRPGSAATVYGWGDTRGDGSYARTLRAADVRISADRTCAEVYPGGERGAYEAASMLCAAAPGGVRDACQGDSGGPLVAGGLLIGLVSWGSGCGAPGRPGVYTRISAVADLVRKHP